jgi:hypothetical protein
MAKIRCDKCNGSGRIACYAHVDNGVCYDCGGSGHSDKRRTRGLRDVDVIYYYVEIMQSMDAYTEAEIQANENWALGKLKSGTAIEEITDKMKASINKRR